MKAVWLSANEFGYEMLKEITELKEITVTSIITLSDDSRTFMYDGIEKKRWYEFGIEVFEIEDINKEIQLIKSLKPDIIYVCGWRQIINKEIIELPPMGTVGFHPTLLPFGRGPAPIINSILMGVKNTGLSMFYLSEGTDNGDIIGQESFYIDDDDYAMDVYNKIIIVGKELIKKYAPLLAKGEAPRILQKDEDAVYFPKRSLKDNEVRLDINSPEEIMRKIRAFSKPYNGAFVKLGDKKIIIWKAEIGDDVASQA